MRKQPACPQWVGNSCWLVRQVRKQQGQGPSGGQWFCFDDNTVEPWDVGKLDAECFGGKESESRAAQGLPQSPRPLGVRLPWLALMHPLRAYSLTSATSAMLDELALPVTCSFDVQCCLRMAGGCLSHSQAGRSRTPMQQQLLTVILAWCTLQVNEYDKQFSAYMLFYERADELEPIDQLRQVSHPAADAAPSSAAAVALPASAPAPSAAAEALAASVTAASTSAPAEPIFSMLVDVRARHPLS